MKKETIELVVVVDIWYEEDATKWNNRDSAIALAKKLVTASSSSFVEPKSAEASRNQKPE